MISSRSDRDMSSAESKPLLHDYGELRLPGHGRFVNEQCASLTYTGSLSAITWRTHLIANWGKFKEGLTEVKLLIICGVHGGRDGSIGDDAHNVKTCEGQVVSLYIQALPTSFRQEFCKEISKCHERRNNS